ncbi:aldehyde dehydrogenase family protein [Geomicrobium sp. JSM 1781026]|uniref:aldehyde dehydrogenase family protein n=1 Tax=Geomicrobium sp. JSM 1781026 TaxID=3344580 RepID=UPI0035C21E11
MIGINEKEQAMFISGEWKQKNEMIEVQDPGKRVTIGYVPNGQKEDMVEALQSAVLGREIAAALTVRERMDILMNVSRLILEEREDIAEIIASEGIKTITEARKEARRAAETLQICAEEARRLTGSTVNFDQMPGNAHRHGYTFMFPIGIIGAITPFNDPLNLVAHKIGPAIAGGNAVVLKPATETPLSALWLTKKFQESGLPDHVLNVVTGRGSEVIPPMIEHPDVRLISFTGGLKTGETLAKQAGLKKIGMELGANSPLIVCKDANIGVAAKAAVDGAFASAGQNCLGVQRMIVHEDVIDTFTEQVTDHTSRLAFGDKMRETDDVGPLINEKEAERMIHRIDEAIDKGARLLCGGVLHGNYLEPTLLTDVPKDTLLYKEEIFGPIAMIESFQSLEEAVRVANDVNYGLQAGIFTASLSNAHYAIQKLHVGGVMVNDSSDFRIDAMPFGGTKGSGLGREGVLSALHEMTEPRVVCFTEIEE